MLVFNKIAIACDHGGVNLKTEIVNFLSQIAIEFIDFGTNDVNKSVDYPDYAKKVTEYICTNQNTCGILICRTGVGMSIAANKFNDIRALLSSGNTEIVRLSREHNNCNVICFGADYIDLKRAASSIKIFLQTKFLGGRHMHRIQKIS